MTAPADVDLVRVARPFDARLRPFFGDLRPDELEWRSAGLRQLQWKPREPHDRGRRCRQRRHVAWKFSDPRLGYTFGDADVVRTKKYGWVAIVASGYRIAHGKGCFFFLDPRTGALLETVATPDGLGSAPLDKRLNWREVTAAE